MISRFDTAAGFSWPSIIQGGMGAGVSDWRLARAVSKAGQLGVVSGTALDTIMIRRLQDGDKDGAIRRALAAFPYPEMAERILEEWFVVEHYSAGGHNAPPRRGDAYSERDVCSIEKIAALSLPFWLAGSCASPERLREAKAMGAQGVQVGSAFACSEESGILPEIKQEIIGQYRSGELNVITDFRASPTDYPFKRVEVEANSTVDACRVCDLGYLRHIYEKEDDVLAYRCPAAPRKGYLAKGGKPEDCEGRRCLCNGLLATIGIGQLRRGRQVQPLVTLGEDLSFLDSVEVGESGLPKAEAVIDYLLS